MKYLLIFLASLSIGVLLNMPRKSLLLASLIAVAGFMVNSSMLRIGAQPQEAAFAGSFAVAILAELLARKMKVPSPVLSIPGIIPLVPGSVAYRATTFLVDGKEISGAETAIGAALTAVGIASGLLLASAISRRVIKPLLARFAESKILPGEIPSTTDEPEGPAPDYSI
jgi:uncharacterized membrane protein YjjB (DUF3815 family)